MLAHIVERMCTKHSYDNSC